jgi:hypothetical protein
METNTIIGWKIHPSNGGNHVFLGAAEGYRERNDGRIVGPNGRLVRIKRGDRIERICRGVR